MKNIFKHSGLRGVGYGLPALTLLVLLFYSSIIFAATPSTVNDGINTYVLIENEVDGDYLITPNTFSPRFTGANTWTKFNTNQTSLGFMGHQWNQPNRYFDIWIDNSPINRPFRGLRCITDGANCPASGYLAADVTDANGIYHTLGGNNENNGSFAYGSLTDSAYQYFASRPVGANDAYVLNVCVTTTNYDYASGVRCKDLTTNAAWRAVNMTLTKVGHLKLYSTNALAEVWVASDGTPSTSLNSEHCNIAIVNNVNGITCRMVSYNYQRSANITSNLVFSMVIDTGTLGFSPAASTIRYSGDGATWYNYSLRTAYSNIFKEAGDGYVYVFLSNTFLKNLVDRGISITNNDSIFTFNFYNAVVPKSGFYQFTASNSLSILPKEYGISIASSDGQAHPKGSGEIGSQQPIELEYTVTTSAERQADSITAQVTGNSVTIDSVPYCLFSSPDNTFKVPIPAYLSYTSQTGATIKERNSCADEPVDLTGALWTQTAWDASTDKGYFFTTNLKLLFPMNNSRSDYTLEGDTWMGTVSASGEIKVEATWIGVNR